MTASERAELYRAFLAEEGYKPKIDEDGDVEFKYEGWVFYISVDDDAEFFRLMCAIWPIESDEERSRVMHNAAYQNARFKAAKVYPVGDDTWASVEMFCSSPDAVLPVLPRAMRCLAECVAKFIIQMAAGS